jgi:hypothetical protein
MIPGEARVFPLTELEQAKAWVADGGPRPRDRKRVARSLGEVSISSESLVVGVLSQSLDLRRSRCTPR